MSIDIVLYFGGRMTILSKILTTSEPKQALKILMVGAEVSPFANVGGYARVLAYLSKSLNRAGHDCRVFMPKFGSIDEAKYPMQLLKVGITVPTDFTEGVTELICNVKTCQLPGNPRVYFLENQEYYEKRANVYGYSDDPVRWALLCRGALEFIRQGDWVPDIIQFNDWHGGCGPNYLKTTYAADPILSHVISVFTIHNLKFQGVFDHHTVSEMDFDDGHSPIESFFSPRLLKQNFMRRGIMYADLVNTVSETYAHEIMTPDFGEGLDKLLQEVRGKLFGVTNGIDYEEFNPATDRYIVKNYDVNTLGTRSENKLALQKEFGLKQNPNIPIIAFVGRLDQQKGIDLILDIVHPLMRDFDVQFVQVGGGDLGYVDAFKKLQEQYPEKVRVHPLPNFTLPRLIFSGADIGLAPSKFEPCGLTQMEYQHYGAIPVVRATGGLADTVINFDAQKGVGTGFVFKDFDKWAFFAQVVRALETYNHKKIWKQLQINAMASDFSWEHAAKDYEKLFYKAEKFHESSPLVESSEGTLSLMSL